MPPQPHEEAQKQASASDVFAIVQQLILQLHENRTEEIIDAVKDLDIEGSQQITDLLGTVLEHKHHVLKNPDRALNLLAEIASSAGIIAHNRIINPKYLTSTSEPSVILYTDQDGPPVRLKVVRRGMMGTPEHYSESLLKRIHLSHSNVSPLYGTFLEGENDPISLVSPCMANTNIVDHTRKLPQASRMPLILDMIDGVWYLHHLSIAHGTLNPQNVLISDGGRAIITGLEAEASETSSARYLAPEIMEEEDPRPTRAGDIWSVGCICYEVLSGNTPFCQFTQEHRVAAAVLKGKKPSRPGQEGVGGEEINDDIWLPVSACWDLEVKNRPRCMEIINTLFGPNSHDDRPAAMPVATLQTTITLGHLERARSFLSRIVGAGESTSPPSQIPEHLRGPLSGLISDIEKAEAAAVAVKKLSPDDTQTLVDALDMVVAENGPTLNTLIPVERVLQKIAVSTHIFPQYYKLDRIRYDPSSIAEVGFGKVYKGSDFDVCVGVIADSSYVSRILTFLTLWARSSHPNIVPFYGVFHDEINEIQRLSLVTPYFKNGTLRDYAPRLPQKSRIPLISDVIHGLEYLHRLNVTHNSIEPNTIVISDEGRGLIASFNAIEMITATNSPMIRSFDGLYFFRYHSPERAGYGVTTDIYSSDIWSFGCLCYEVLSRKVPYHQYETVAEIRSALSRAEPLRRPTPIDSDMDQINEEFWGMITKCCTPAPQGRPVASGIKEFFASMKIEDDRPEAPSLSGIDIISSRSYPEIKWDRVEHLLSHIQVELLRTPLLKLIRNRTKDAATAAAKLQHNDIQTMVDFLDGTLKDHLTIVDERNRVLALLSGVMTLTQVFPRRLELKSIKYDPRPIAEGGFGKVHRGLSDPNICVKVTTRVNDNRALIDYIRELILWAHASHPNVLPFYGVFFDELRQICLVSPYMTKGNLRDYASQLPQKARIPLLIDTIKGLDYLHGLGVVHTDLKGENVLISDEGRALITDFGASHIITATAKGEATSASVATTLRFTAPEIILDQTRQVRPTKECDIWSFGCLTYHVLSRKLPYYEYQLDAQVFAALLRGQLPKRPGLSTHGKDDNEDGDDWDDFDEQDWDDLDDTIWALVLMCLAPKPGDRPSGSRVLEVILDVWYSRPVAKGVPGAEIMKPRSNSEVDLNRVGTLLYNLQILLLAKSIFRYSTEAVVMAAANLSYEDSGNLMSFWAWTLDCHLTSDGELGRLLEIQSIAIESQRTFVPGGYVLWKWPRCHMETIGDGSFGKVYRGFELNHSICVKVMGDGQMHSQMHPGFRAQWSKALAPWAHLSHPNILPLYGVFFMTSWFLVLPFVGNGNLQSYAHNLPQKSRLLLISDVVEGLMYLHRYGVVHGNLKMQNVLVSDEGRGLITDFRPYHTNLAAAIDGPTSSFITNTLRFTAPELVKNDQMLPTPESDVWSVGCLIYEVLSRRVPYYEYTEDSQIRSALSQEELLSRPTLADENVDLIDDGFWELIGRCCTAQPQDRLNLMNVQHELQNMVLEDNRPAAKPLLAADILKYRHQYGFVDIDNAGEVLDKLKRNLPG